MRKAEKARHEWTPSEQIYVSIFYLEPFRESMRRVNEAKLIMGERAWVCYAMV